MCFFLRCSQVKAAAEKALAEYKQLHPDVADEDIKVDLPVAPPAAPPPPVPAFPAVNALHVGMMRQLPNVGGGWGAGGGWNAPAGFGVGAQQPDPFGMPFNPYLHLPVPPIPVPLPLPAFAPLPPVRNVPAPRRRNVVAREARPRRGQPAVNPNPNINAIAGPANQRGVNVAAVVAPAQLRPDTRAARAVANPEPAANALVNPFAAPRPPRAVRAFGANPEDPFALPFAPPAPPAAVHHHPAVLPPRPPPPAAAVAPRPRKAARAADRQAHMEEARAAIERQRARNELRMARGRQEAAQLRARLERVREEMGMARGDGGGGGKRRGAGAR